MSFGPKGYALSAGDGTAVWFLDTRMTVKAGGDETNGAFTFLEWAVPAGFGPPPHRHDREDEAFYLIEGAIEVSCGDRQWEVGLAGSSSCRAASCIGSSSPLGRSGGLQVTAPAGFERFIGELGIPAPGPGLPPPSAPDVPRLIQTSARYGYEILGPPPA